MDRRRPRHGRAPRRVARRVLGPGTGRMPQAASAHGHRLPCPGLDLALRQPVRDRRQGPGLPADQGRGDPQGPAEQLQGGTVGRGPRPARRGHGPRPSRRTPARPGSWRGAGRRPGRRRGHPGRRVRLRGPRLRLGHGRGVLVRARRLPARGLEPAGPAAGLGHALALRPGLRPAAACALGRHLPRRAGPGLPGPTHPDRRHGAPHHGGLRLLPRPQGAHPALPGRAEDEREVRLFTRSPLSGNQPPHPRRAQAAARQLDLLEEQAVQPA